MNSVKIEQEVKRKLNLSPERRAQLSVAMKTRLAAKRAAEANALESSPQPAEGGAAAV